MPYSRRPSYYVQQMQEWNPWGTWVLLGIIAAVFVAQYIVLAFSGPELYLTLFSIDMHWPFEPWTLVTSTLSHAGFAHLFFNGIILFFFGPLLERLIGTKRFVVLFFVSGAIAGILQVYLQWFLFDLDRGGLGASGALMMVFGALMIVMPHEKILIWGIIPVPFWAAGVGYAAIDILGAFNPMSQIGNFAHLSGLAIGIYVGLRIRGEMRRQGLRYGRS